MSDTYPLVSGDGVVGEFKRVIQRLEHENQALRMRLEIYQQLIQVVAPVIEQNYPDAWRILMEKAKELEPKASDAP